MDAPILYIIAGPNGIGKTTSAFDIIPQNIPIINSDEIAKQVKAAELVKINTQEYSNRETQLLVQQHLAERKTFAIETNLADVETWKFLTGIQKEGYVLHLVYLSTDDIQLLNNRITERHLRGEHFVRPDIVEERYYVSLKLLAHYFNIPEVVQLTDNSETLRPIAIKNKEHLELLTNDFPGWFTDYLYDYFVLAKKQKPVKDLSEIDEVRKRYKQGEK